MSDGPTRRRRTVLAACAAGAAALAGCGNPLSDSGEGGGSTGKNDTGGGAGNDTSAEENDTGGQTGNDTSTGENDTGGQADNDTSTGENETLGQSGGSTTIRLGGETEGWTGEEPEAIAGETNPTLQLQADTTYEIVWDNLDGEEHELILADENGEEVEASEESATEGESVTLEFTASQDLAEYFCEYHPDSMRGEIEVVEGE